MRGNDAEDGSGRFERTHAQPDDFREQWFMNRDYIVERHDMICVSRGPEVAFLPQRRWKRDNLNKLQGKA